MKTIGLFSYKGGVGKTLAAANLAVCLSRQGKTCALVDLDFDSPSIHTKLPEASAPGAQGGLLQLLIGCLQQSEWDESHMTKVSWIEPTDMARFSQQISQGPRDAGFLHMIPAGNIFSRQHIEDNNSPVGRRLLRIFSELEFKRMTPQAFADAALFLLIIKSSIAELNPKPDFLIVDFKSSDLEAAYTIANLWLDQLLYFFSYNMDHMSFLPMAYRSFHPRESSVLKELCVYKSKLLEAGVEYAHHLDIPDPDSEIDIVPVLSRVPDGIDYRSDGMLKHLLQKGRINRAGTKRGVQQSASIDRPLIILHSDRETERYEHLTLGHRIKPRDCRLAHDYVRLAAVILNPTVDNAQLKSAATQIAIQVGLDSETVDYERVFDFHSTTGALINPKDGSRNVSFKVETFQLLLAGFSAVLEKDPFQHGLLEAGHNCGEKFGRALRTQWDDLASEDSRDAGAQARLQQWCAFDSDVGFGRLEILPESVGVRQGKIEEFTVMLRESFLTPSRDVSVLRQDESDEKFCAFMAGYIEGVVEVILNSKVEVTHKLGDYDSADSRSKDSFYLVKVSNSPLT